MIAPWKLSEGRPCSPSGVKLDGDRLLRFIYVDESGISVNEASTVVAGIIVQGDKQWRAVADHLAGLVKKYVREEHRAGFVFHAKELFAGTGNVFGDRATYPRELRHEALRSLLAIPSQFKLPLVFGISPKRPGEDTTTKAMRRMAASKHQSKTFALCVLAAETSMRQMAGRKEIAALVAENNTDTRKMVERMHQVLQGRERSKSALGILNVLSELAPDTLPITKIVDTVHFARKSDAPLLQIADACALVIRYHFEGKSDTSGFFNALTEDKPERLQIGTGGCGGFAILNFSPISRAKMYARVILPVPWGIIKILTKPLWKRWNRSPIRNP